MLVCSAYIKCPKQPAFIGSLCTVIFFIASPSECSEDRTDERAMLFNSGTYEFKLGHNAVESIKNIRCAKGEGSVINITLTRRLKFFSCVAKTSTITQGHVGHKPYILSRTQKVRRGLDTSLS